ncbi:hypothetical protein ACO2RV_07915 [Ancylobacter sp. VNQ12]|uniref:hypothetical protein n=1 Tax=Ancylobacter sp. VNQ12 TaxID=3400920 RepID=UPI003C06A7B8
MSITDIAAGAGLGAAVMWAINEWETGKWNVAVPGTAVAATAPLVAANAPVAAVAASAPAAAAETAMTTTPPELEPRHRVDSGVATAETLAKWEVDEKEPSWDPSALAETWAKLRRELSTTRPARPAVAPDLPRTAQLAKGPIAKGPISGRPSTTSSTGIGASQAAKAPLGSLAKAYASNQRPSGTSGSYAGSTVSKPSYTSTTGHSGSSGTSLSGSSSTPPRKVASAGEPARQTGSFLRPGTSRPR